MNILDQLSKLKSIGVAIAALFPSLIAAVQAAETALGPGVGAAKLAFVQNTLAAIYGTIQTAEVAWTDLLPSLTTVINALVTAFNAIKAFGHAGAPAVVTVAAGATAATSVKP